MMEPTPGNQRATRHEAKATHTPPRSELHAFSLPRAPTGFIEEVSEMLESAHFACKLSGTIEGPLKVRGRGALTLTVKNTLGDPIATYATLYGALTPADITHLCRLFNQAEQPHLALASCLRYLDDIAGVELRPLADKPFSPPHPEIPGALSTVPDLGAFIRDPNAVPNHFSVPRLTGEGANECVTGEICPPEGILLINIEKRESAQESTRRFRVTSPATLKLTDAQRREHLLGIARFLVTEFSAQGSEGLVDQLAKLTPPAQELPAQETTALVTDSELLWSKLPDGLAQIRRNSQTGTTTKLFLGESKAAIVIAPDDNLTGNIEPIIIFTNTSHTQRSYLSDVQLEYINRCFDRLSSHLWSERSSGLRMLFSVGSERTAAFGPTNGPVENDATPFLPHLRGQLLALKIDRNSRSANFLSDFPRSVLEETSRFDWIGVAADPPTARTGFADALENSASRVYTMWNHRVPWRLELLQSMRITRRADGMMSVSANTPFGAKMYSRMEDTIGLRAEEVDQREAALVGAFARQKFSGWLTLQHEIETQMYGSDALDMSEGGAWDGSLVGLPPRSDAAGIQAWALAGTLVHQAMRFKHKDEATFRAAWVAPGRVVLCVHPTESARFLELSLCGDRLEELRIGRTDSHKASLPLHGQREGRKTLKETPDRFQPSAPLYLRDEDRWYVSKIIENEVEFDFGHSISSRGPITSPIFGDVILTTFFNERFRRLSP